MTENLTTSAAESEQDNEPTVLDYSTLQQTTTSEIQSNLTALKQKGLEDTPSNRFAMRNVYNLLRQTEAAIERLRQRP